MIVETWVGNSVTSFKGQLGPFPKKVNVLPEAAIVAEQSRACCILDIWSGWSRVRTSARAIKCSWVGDAKLKSYCLLQHVVINNSRCRAELHWAFGHGAADAKSLLILGHRHSRYYNVIIGLKMIVPTVNWAVNWVSETYSLVSHFFPVSIQYLQCIHCLLQIDVHLVFSINLVCVLCLVNQKNR